MLDASPSLRPSALPLRAVRLPRPHWPVLLIAAADVLAVELSILISLGLRWHYDDLFGKAVHFDYQLPVLAGIAIVAVNSCLGLYPGYGISAPDRFRRRLLAVLLVFAFIAGWDYLLQHGLWSRLITVLSCILAALLTATFSDAARRSLQATASWGRPVAVYATGESAERLVALLRRRSDLGFIPVACLADAPVEPGASIAGLPLIGPISSAVERLPDVRHVFVHLPHLPPERWETVTSHLRFPQVFLIPGVTGRRSLWVRTSDLQGTLALSLADNLLNRRKLALKRAMDLCIAAPLLLLLLPFLAGLCIAVRLTSPGPALFVQNRVGQHGRIYRAYKFRTMVADAEAMLARHLAESAEARIEYSVYRKLRRDPRVTPVGRILRRYSLDELPQLVNVLKGEMSLVGPRCYLPDELRDMGGNQSLIQNVKPGMTGYWQISGRNRTTFSERVEMDVYYIRNWSVSFDLYILHETLRVVLTGRDAY